MDGTQEVARSLVVARGNNAVLLEASEEVLYQAPSLVELTVILALALVRHPRGNHHFLSLFQQRLNEPGLGIVGFVGNDGLPARSLLGGGAAAILGMLLMNIGRIRLMRFERAGRV